MNQNFCFITEDVYVVILKRTMSMKKKQSKSQLNILKQLKTKLSEKYVM